MVWHISGRLYPLENVLDYLLNMGMVARENIVNIHSLDRGNIIVHEATCSHATYRHRNTGSYSCSSGEQVPLVKTWKGTMRSSICTSPGKCFFNWYDALFFNMAVISMILFYLTYLFTCARGTGTSFLITENVPDHCKQQQKIIYQYWE